MSIFGGAKSIRSDGDAPEVTLGHVEKGIAALKKAGEVAQVFRSVLGGVVQAGLDALLVGALERAKASYKAADEYIGKRPHNNSEVKKRAEIANFESNIIDYFLPIDLINEVPS